MTTDLMPCTLYGDHETCTDLRTDATALAAHSGLDPIAWFHDPTGLRGLPGPSHAPGLANALAHCAATGTPLFIPYSPDAPGEQMMRLVAHWLDRHGLQLFVGHLEYIWSRPTDEIDFAMRRQLDASSDLALAVAVAGNMPDLDRLAGDLLHGPTSVHSVEAARAIAAECEASGESVPPEPVARAPWPVRQSAVHGYASWLTSRGSQQFTADVLNELGVRTRSGRTWTQSAVSRLLQPSTPANRRAA
jgi:hypothetical protein